MVKQTSKPFFGDSANSHLGDHGVTSVRATMVSGGVAEVCSAVGEEAANDTARPVRTTGRSRHLSMDANWRGCGGVGPSLTAHKTVASSARHPCGKMSDKTKSEKKHR